MAKIKVKTYGSHMHITLKLAFGEEVSIHESALLEGGTRYGLLRPDRIGFGKIIYADIKGMSVGDYLKSSISKNDVIRVIEQFLIVVMEIKEMGLDLDSLIMDVALSYIDTGKNEIQMLYSKLIDSSTRKLKAEDFICDILDRFETENASDLNFRRRFINFLEKAGNPDLYKIEDFLAGEGKAIVRDVRNKYYRLICNVPQGRRQEQEFSDEDEPTEFAEDGFEDNGLADEDEPTEFAEDSLVGDKLGGDSLTDEDELTEFAEGGFAEDELTEFAKSGDVTEGLEENGPRLLRKRTDETIFINKPVFRIGREMGKVDYCIPDNRNISRGHIDLICRKNNYYIVDLKSKNRTFINERVILSNVEVELHNGDVIKIGDEEFIFSVD